MRILLLLALLKVGIVFGQNDPLTSRMLLQKLNPAFIHGSSPDVLDLQYQLNTKTNFQSVYLLSEIGRPTSSFWQGSMFYQSNFPGEHKIEFRALYGRQSRMCKLHHRNHRYFGVSSSIETIQGNDSKRTIVPDINFGYFRMINRFQFGFSTAQLSRSIINYDSLVPSLNLHGSIYRTLNRKWTANINGLLNLSQNKPFYRAEFHLKQRWDKLSYGVFWQSNRLLGTELSFQMLIDGERTYFNKPIYFGAGFGYDYFNQSLTASVSFRLPLYTLNTLLSERKNSDKKTEVEPLK